jgi:mercuric ion binding protein
VTKAIEKLDGVTDVNVDLDTKTATVTFDDQVTSSSAIAAASTNAGYPATPLQTGAT